MLCIFRGSNNIDRIAYHSHQSFFFLPFEHNQGNEFNRTEESILLHEYVAFTRISIGKRDIYAKAHLILMAFVHRMNYTVADSLPTPNHSQTQQGAIDGKNKIIK